MMKEIAEAYLKRHREAILVTGGPEWVSAFDMAERLGVSIDDVELMAGAGQLGRRVEFNTDGVAHLYCTLPVTENAP